MPSWRRRFTVDLRLESRRISPPMPRAVALPLPDWEELRPAGPGKCSLRPKRLDAGSAVSHVIRDLMEDGGPSEG